MDDVSQRPNGKPELCCLLPPVDGAIGITFILRLVICDLQHDLNDVFFNIMRENPDKNIAVAPFLFRFSLCRLANVASGATRQEIMSVLKIRSDYEIKQCFLDIAPELGKVMELDLTLLNMMYVNYTDDISPKFIGEARNYAVTVIKIGFSYPKAATEFVNREFEKSTLKNIQDVLDISDIDSNSSILLVNGAHFKVTWENYFNLKKTKKMIFRGKNTTEVMMMNRVQTCMYLDMPKELLKAVSFHLAGYGTTITFLLPYPVSNLRRLIGTVQKNPNFLSDLTPKMAFKEIGLNLTTSSDNTGLNSILKNVIGKNMYVSKAKQKIFIQVDEMGSVRPTIPKMGEGHVRNSIELTDDMNDPFPEFMANRPFLFLLTLATEPGYPDTTTFELARGAFHGPHD